LSLRKTKEVKKTVVILLLLCEKILPDIENMRSTAADEALTERNYLAKLAKNGKVLLCCFQNFTFPFLNG
jgi:hypothetical protein